jgi:glycosyltransferase involved in cell wall biosynthesis
MTGSLQTGPKLSVIVLVYNVEPYLKRCIDSILAQDLADYELLLVAERRSADRSLEICQRFAGADKRAKVLVEDGAGFAAARNRGLDEACGEYVTFIDADDYILPGMFGAMYGEARKQATDILCCGGKKDLGGQRLEDMGDYVKFSDGLFAVGPQNQRDYMYRLAVSGRTITAWGKLYSRAFLNGNRLRFHPEAYSDDYVFNFGCYTAARRVGTMGQSFYVYCDRGDSRVYSSETSDIVRSTEILWGLYQGYGGAAKKEVMAYAATRIISSTLFNLKLKPLGLDRICAIVWEIVHKLGMGRHLLNAADRGNFRAYAYATGLSGQNAENYRLFIESLQSYTTMLAWQTRYADAEDKANQGGE